MSSMKLVLVLAVLLAACTANSPRSPQSGPKAEFMLSFDDGPLHGATERVLKSLSTIRAEDGRPVRAGFFLLADAPEVFWERRFFYAPYELWAEKGSIARFPELAREIQNAGHLVGNHTTHHGWFHWPWLDTRAAVEKELRDWEAVAMPALGTLEQRLFRPPYLIVTETVRQTARGLGYRVILGESSGDATPRITLAELKAKTQAILDGWRRPIPCVLIFHDPRPVTYQHLEEVVANLREHGFHLVHFDPHRI